MSGASSSRAPKNNGPNFAVYDISADCRHPVLKSSIDLPGSEGHMGNFAPDGRTYYVGQSLEASAASCTSWTSPTRPIRAAPHLAVPG